MGGDAGQLGQRPPWPEWFQGYQMQQQAIWNRQWNQQLQAVQPQLQAVQQPGWVEEYVEGTGRALRLLNRHLTPDQQWTLERFSYFDVKGRLARSQLRRWWSRNRYKGTEPRWHTYRLGGDGSVHEVDGNKPMTAYCIRIYNPENVPLWDRLLALKLMIESDLLEFLKTAKVLRQYP